MLFCKIIDPCALSLYTRIGFSLVPLNKIDPSWKVASELTLKAFLSHHLISKEFKSQYQASKFGFTIQGDFNHDAREDLGIVGVYISEDGGGRFLLVLSKTESGGWEKYYLKKWEGKRGLIYFDKTKKTIWRYGFVITVTPLKY